jgi:hypothetical protein
MNKTLPNRFCMRKIILSALVIVGFAAIGRSQSTTPFTFNSTGGTYDNPSSYYRFEWSISEMTMINTVNTADSSCRLLHGVLQPGTEKPVYPPTVLFESGDYTIFPNPTPDRFELNFFVSHTGRMQLQLTDATGRILETRNYLYDGVRRIQLFDLGKYPSGLYYVMAKLVPDANRMFDNLKVTRWSGLKVIKM